MLDWRVYTLHSPLVIGVDCYATLSAVSVWSEYPADTSPKSDTSDTGALRVNQKSSKD